MDYIKYQGKCWVPSGDGFTGKPVGDVDEMIAKARSQAFEECAGIAGSEFAKENDGDFLFAGGKIISEAIRRKGAER